MQAFDILSHLGLTRLTSASPKLCPLCRTQEAACRYGQQRR